MKRASVLQAEIGGFDMTTRQNLFRKGHGSIVPISPRRTSHFSSRKSRIHLTVLYMPTK